VLDFPPILFMAMANVVWASMEMLPKDIAPVANLRTMLAAGSTWNKFELQWDIETHLAGSGVGFENLFKKKQK
jgi:hypothetical protein